MGRRSGKADSELQRFGGLFRVLIPINQEDRQEVYG